MMDRPLLTSATLEHGASQFGDQHIVSREGVLPVVPMFHINAWCLPYAALIGGAKLVLPGPRLDAASLYELMETERVTVSAGVPTIWMGLIQHVEQHKLRFTTMRRTGVMQIRDRTKDVIKSGGEWISSIDLENAAVAHPAVAMAAVIGVKHPKWDERPAFHRAQTGPAAGQTANSGLPHGARRQVVAARERHVCRQPATGRHRYGHAFSGE